MDLDPLENASPEVLNAVDAMGGEALLATIDDLVQANEERTLEWFDALWDDLTADEVIGWSIATLAKTGPGLAHAALDVALRTYPVGDEDDEAVVGAATMVTAFIRVVFGPQVRSDRYELDFGSLSEWIQHDVVRVVDGPSPGTAAAD